MNLSYSQIIILIFFVYIVAQIKLSIYDRIYRKKLLKEDREEREQSNETLLKTEWQDRKKYTKDLVQSEWQDRKKYIDEGREESRIFREKAIKSLDVINQVLAEICRKTTSDVR